MHQRTTLCFLLFTFFFCLAVRGQQKLENTLLWRISGNGLKEPSYVYGTMHITDKRVFQLGDSVHAAMANTSGLAAELDMFSVANEMIAGFLDNYEEEDESQNGRRAVIQEVLVKNELEKSQWDRYKKSLEKVLKIKADKITVSDLGRYRKYQKEKMYHGEGMSTVLDAWLLGYAKKNGKWVGGIEDFSDQEEHLSSKTLTVESMVEDIIYDGKYYDTRLDWMIDQYLQARLDAVEKLYNGESGEKDLIMIKRNKKMAYRMDSLSAVRSTFFAIGMAHLPGDEGVINLLRDKGFTVTPVFSTKKINVSDLNPVSQDSYWSVFPFADNVFSLKLPGTPVKLTKGIGELLDIYFHYDFTTMKVYMTMYIPVHNEQKGDALKRIIQSLSKPDQKNGNQLKQQQEVTVKGMPGVNFLATNSGGEMKGQIIELDGKMVVLNVAIAFSEKELAHTDINYFLQSFAFDEHKLSQLSSENNWKKMENKTFSFSVNMLENAKSKVDVNVGDARSENNWQAYDAKNQIYYSLSVLSLKKGFYHADPDTIYLLRIKDNLAKALGNARVEDSTFSELSGYPVYTATISGESEGQAVKMQYKMVLRGGLVYYLFTTYEATNENDIRSNEFMNSLKLLPYTYSDWEIVKPKTGAFSLKAPGIIEEREEDLAELNTYQKRFTNMYHLYDSVASYTLVIDKSIIPDWFWASADTTFLRKQAETHVGWNDSLINYRLQETGTLKQATFYVIKRGTSIVKQVKLVLNGNELYELYGYLSAVDTLNKQNDYFNNFTLTNELKAVNRNKAKMPALQQELNKATVEQMQHIRKWIKNIDFTIDELAALKTMAFKAYPDIDSSYYYSMNKYILDVISTLDSTYTMADDIAGNFEKLTGKDEALKPYILNYLSGIKKRNAYDKLKYLLINGTNHIDADNMLYLDVYDSLSLTATLYPDVLAALDKPNLWPTLMSPLQSLLEKEEIDPAIILPYREKMITLAKKLIDTEKEQVEENPYRYMDIVRVLTYFKDEASNKAIAGFLSVENIALKFEVVKALLKNNQPVSEDVLIFLAKDDYYRFDLYEFLDQQKRLSLFPPIYANRIGLGKSKLYTMLTDEEESTPANIIFLEEKTARFKSKEYKFLLYIVSFEEEDDNGNKYLVEYLGIAGPYSLKGKELLPQPGATGLNWMDHYSKPKTNELFKKYLSDLEATEE